MTANASSWSPGAAPNKSLDLIEPSIPNPPRGPINHPAHRSIRSRKRLRVPVPTGVPAQPSAPFKLWSQSTFPPFASKNRGGCPASRRFPTPSLLRVDISHPRPQKSGGVPLRTAGACSRFPNHNRPSGRSGQPVPLAQPQKNRGGCPAAPFPRVSSGQSAGRCHPSPRAGRHPFVACGPSSEDYPAGSMETPFRGDDYEQPFD